MDGVRGHSHLHTVLMLQVSEPAQQKVRPDAPLCSLFVRSFWSCWLSESIVCSSENHFLSHTGNTKLIREQRPGQRG